MMWHIVCGDVAAKSLAPLVEQDSESHIRVLRDDLAIGPLNDVDLSPCVLRADFWRAVWPPESALAPDFRADLVADCQWLRDLPQQVGYVTVWHGDSASEQLMLARVAHWLADAPISFLEVNCGTGESHSGGRRAVGMCSSELLASFAPQEVSIIRRKQLADVWQTQRASPALLRRWCEGMFVVDDFAEPDSVLVAACGATWQPLARVMAEVMKEAEGYFPTDYFVYWRARELATQGRVVIDGDTGQGYVGLQVRRPG